LIRVGDAAPALAGITVTGASADLAALLPRRVVVEFFRGTWCPNCRRRLAALREAFGRFEEADASLIGVVCQKRSNAEGFFAKDPLPFPLVVDEDRSIARRWSVYQRLGIDAIHISRPATFVVDGSGTVRLASVAPNQLTRVSLEEVFDCLARCPV
jgi:peroxiredoxin